MNVADVLLSLLIILLTARVFGEIAIRLGAPSVIGELLAGVVLGPSLFGWIEPNEIIHLLAEIGIILLLFDVGLETDLGNLVRSGSKSFIVALGGFLAPFIAGSAVSYWVFDLSLLPALFIGGTLTATSIGITVRTLTDLNKQNSPEGQITLGAAVLDDILGVVLLALLYEFSVNGEVNLAKAGRILLLVCVFFAIAPVLATMFSKLIQIFDRRIDNPGLLPTTIVALVLFFAWLAHLFGAPELLGGFAAGIALSRRFFLPFGIALHTDSNFANKVELQIKPIVQLFTPIFFVGVGLSLDLREVAWTSGFFWSFSLLLLAIAIVTKFAGALLIDEPFLRRIIVGMSMVPRGEVGLIFAGLGAAAGIFTTEIYTALIMVIAYTTLLSPFWIKLYYKKLER